MSHHNRHRGSNPLEAGSNGHAMSSDESVHDNAIVPRDDHGNYQFETAVLAVSPSMQYRDLEEQAEERAQIEEAEEKILDAWRQHPEEQDEEDIKALLAQILEKKMQSLEEDKWVFEAEESKKG
jgi:hypothetical protein